MFGGWAVRLGDTIFVAGCEGAQAEWDALECLPAQVIEGLDGAPDGLGLPGLRTEDTTYAQRDGVKHFSDWYEPRILTMTGTVGVTHLDCAECVAAREELFTLIGEWERTCCDTELVIFPPCEPADTREGRILTGPYGVVGRPRVAQYQWLERAEQLAEVLLRFDGTDQRLYVLDECGTPGFAECETVMPGSATYCRSYPRCYDPTLCYTTLVGNAVLPTQITVGGTQRVFPTITLVPLLSNPRIENQTTGDWLTYAGTVTGSPVIIDTENGTATQDGQSRTHLLRGNFFMSLTPGVYDFRVLSSSPDDDGYVDICVRDTVVVA